MTKIEWTHRPGTTGETWSPVTGCTPVSEGCAHCFARRMAKRLAGRFGYPEAPHEFDVTLHENRLNQPYDWSKPRTAFLCSMSDFFHPAVPFEFQLRVLQVIRECPRHTFIVLTKRPEQVALWEHVCGWTPYPNLWLGVTAENQKCADERIPILLGIPAAVRFVSVEPMLGPMNLADLPVDARTYINAFTGRERFTGAITGFGTSTGSHLDWAICGGETGPGARPMDPRWARDLLKQCRAAGVPFFMKQMSNRAPIPPDLQIREWPNEETT